MRAVEHRLILAVESIINGSMCADNLRLCVCVCVCVCVREMYGVCASVSQ
jgi:hypothetical protein